jgi:hypothetical protein
MFAPLLNSERFQTEYRKFQTDIESINDDVVKAELKGLLDKLVYAVRNIDNHHEEILINKNTSSSVDELRGNIQKLRQEIDTKLRAVLQ